MDENIKILLGIGSSVGLSQLLLFWVTRRSKKADAREDRDLATEGSYVAERRELLTTLRAQLLAEQSQRMAAESKNIDLMKEHFALQQFCNEVVVKYDFLRNLSPEAGLPAITLDQGRSQATPAPTPTTVTEGGNERA